VGVQVAKVTSLLGEYGSFLSTMYPSEDLQWLLLRQNNSFMVKRGPEGPIFSKEAGNLRNLHSHKYSGLANSKTISVDADSEGKVSIVSRKLSSGPRTIRKSRHSQSVRGRSGPRRSLGVASSHARRGYRPDLRTAALARVSALVISNSGKPQPVREKKARGKKATKAASE